MKLLVLTGPLHPLRSNNANLLLKLLPHLAKGCSVCLAAPAGAGKMPDCIDGFPVRWLRDREDLYRRLVIPAAGKLTDRNGHSDMVQALVLRRALKRLQQEAPFDAVLCSMEPYPSALAALGLKGVRRFLYLMDPPAITCGGARTPLRDRMLPKILSAQELVLTTPFIRAALQEQGFQACFREVGFPMIESHPLPCREKDGGKIDLLFCGWLYSDIRSPRYFLDLAKHLDEGFRITFMGKECDQLRARFDFETKAEVVTLPQQPYEAALEAMASADILINIGNSVPVHMPSKTLEYINARKPIVNFHKLPDCPTLHYTRRYPLCLNLYEGDPITEDTIAQFLRFCAESRGKSAPIPELPECTPEYIAQVILDGIGE